MINNNLTSCFKTPQVTVYNGECLSVLKSLPDNSIDCCISSPPFYKLRDYGTATWEGGDPDCDHVANPKANKSFGNPDFNKNRPSREATKTADYYADICPKCGAKKIDYQIGLEPTVSEYIDALVAVFTEVYRVLKPSGSCWVNLGDSYAGSGKGRLGNGTAAATGKQATNTGSTLGVITKMKDKTIKPKSLCLVPQRFAIAAQEIGFLVRNEVIWSKKHPCRHL